MMANMRRARPPMTVPRRPPEAEEARRNGLARKLARRQRAGALLAPLQTLAASPPYRRALALQNSVESASGLIGKVHPAVAVAPVEVDARDRLFQRFHAGICRDHPPSRRCLPFRSLRRGCAPERFARRPR